MKSILTALLLAPLAALHAADALAQESPRPAASGSLDELFKRLDRNSDGKLDASEAGEAGFFRPADRNGDGFVTLAEARAYAQEGAVRNPGRTAGMEGDGAGPMTSRVKPVEISETESPIQTLDAKASDDRAVRAFWPHAGALPEVSAEALADLEAAEWEAPSDALLADASPRSNSDLVREINQLLRQP